MEQLTTFTRKSHVFQIIRSIGLNMNVTKTIVKFLPEACLGPLTIKQGFLDSQCGILSRASMVHNHALTFESVPE